jgi:hypothetical protein
VFEAIDEKQSKGGEVDGKRRVNFDAVKKAGISTSQVCLALPGRANLGFQCMQYLRSWPECQLKSSDPAWTVISHDRQGA